MLVAAGPIAAQCAWSYSCSVCLELAAQCASSHAVDEWMVRADARVLTESEC